MMNRSNKSNVLVSKVLLSAALAAVPVFGLASWAHAQNRVGSDGHALDASNRIGSGGYNSGNNGGNNSAFGNSTNILTGNVSGLNYFHGHTNGIFDGNTVQANTESAASDQINRTTASANGQAGQGLMGQTTSGNFQPFYNSSKTTTPPPGFVAAPNGAGYMPAPRLNPLTPDPDSRLGDVNLNNTTQSLLPSPGEVDMPGPVDPSGAQSLYTMSPLYGVRKNDSGNASDSFFVSQYSNFRQTSPADRNRLDPTAVRRMQDELNNSSLSNDAQTGSQTGSQTDNTQTNNGQTPDGNSGATNGQPTPVPGAVNTGAADQLKSGALNSNQLSSDAMTQQVSNSQLDNSTLDNKQGTQNRVMIPANKQSAQLQALEKRFAGQRLTDVQSTELYNQQQRLLAKQADMKSTTGTKGQGTQPGTGSPATPALPGGAGTTDRVTPTTGPSADAKPDVPVLNGHETSTDNQPYVVTSLATGIKAKGLAELLKSAEEQMRSGKFSQAIDTYDTAEEVASNNPFVPLGRGFAELGRSYYAKADADIARAVNAEPALLAGNYDLKGFIGDDRVRFVQNDLQQIAATEKGARAPVLLAFIAHNTGDDTAAAKQLNDAETRGGYAPMVALMRQAWNIKAAAPAK